MTGKVSHLMRLQRGLGGNSQIKGIQDEIRVNRVESIQHRVAIRQFSDGASLAQCKTVYLLLLFIKLEVLLVKVSNSLYYTKISQKLLLSLNTFSSNQSRSITLALQ